MEQYKSGTDVNQMLVIPDNKFLRRARSRCLFLSACLNVLVGLQRSDNTKVLCHQKKKKKQKTTD